MNALNIGTSEALNKSEQDLLYLRKAVDLASMVTFTNEQGTITYVNSKFCEISKYSKDEIIGKTHQIVHSGFHPPWFFDQMWKTISSGRSWVGEIKNRAKDGSFYWLETTIVPFMNPNGKPFRYVAISHEITPSKILWEQTEQYKKTIQSVEQFAEIGEITMGLTHELTTPLTAMRARIELFRRNLEKKSLTQNEVRAFSETLDRLTDRMYSLIHYINAFSSTEKVQKPKWINLSSTLRDIVNLHGEEAIQKGIQLRFESTDAPIQCWTEPVLLFDLVHQWIRSSSRSSRFEPEKTLTIQIKDHQDEIYCTLESSFAGQKPMADQLKTFESIAEKLHGKIRSELTGSSMHRWTLTLPKHPYH